MRFKAGNCSFLLSFSFFAATAIMITGGRSEIYLRILYFAFFHELGHAVALKVFGYKILSVSLTAFGARIKCERFDDADNLEKALVWLSGAFVNLLFAAVFSVIGGYKREAENNLLLALFNLLPYYDFDGWNAMLCITECFSVKNKTLFYIKHISSITVVLLFTSLNIILTLTEKPDIMLIFMNLYLVFGLMRYLKPSE